MDNSTEAKCGLPPVSGRGPSKIPHSFYPFFRNYLEAGERGAARYELRLLACSLANKEISPLISVGLDV